VRGCDQFEESAVRTLEIDNARAGAGTVSHPVWRPDWSPAVYGTQLEHPIEVRDRQRDVRRANARRGARSLRRLGRDVLQELDSLVAERDRSCADRRPSPTPVVAAVVSASSEKTRSTVKPSPDHHSDKASSRSVTVSPE
jgi:hypothetical protein